MWEESCLWVYLTDQLYLLAGGQPLDTFWQFISYFSQSLSLINFIHQYPFMIQLMTQHQLVIPVKIGQDLVYISSHSVIHARIAVSPIITWSYYTWVKTEAD